MQLLTLRRAHRTHESLHLKSSHQGTPFIQNQERALFLKVQPNKIALPMPVSCQDVLGKSQGQRRGWGGAGSLDQVSEFDISCEWQLSI